MEGITELHKFTIAEHKIMDFLKFKDMSATELTLQEFFAWIAMNKDKELRSDSYMKDIQTAESIRRDRDEELFASPSAIKILSRRYKVDARRVRKIL